MSAYFDMLSRRAAAAAAWRKENPEMADCGWVLFHRGKVTGWTRELEDKEAYRWVPGVMAVGVHGANAAIYQATGGNEAAGATEWSLIWNPAALAETGAEADALLEKAGLIR